MKRQLKLPPDPERMNNKRADWAEDALLTFEAGTGVEREDAVCDLLADLMHFCDRNEFNFSHELNRAQDHYEAETEQ